MGMEIQQMVAICNDADSVQDPYYTSGVVKFLNKVV